jgi:hypothetical protein
VSVDDHGSPSTYKNWGCRCDHCKAAHAAEQRRLRANRIARRDEATLPHGSPSTYFNWGCRCEDCKAAKAAQALRLRARKRASS